MKNLIRLLIVFVIFPAFTLEGKDAKQLKRFFDKSDVKNINKLISEFDHYLCDKYATSISDVAYNKFFEELLQVKSVSEFKEKLNIPCETRAHIWSQIEQRTLSKIWNISSSTKNSDYKIGGINLNGDYIRYLNEVGKNNELIREYTHSIIGAGDISPSCFSLFIIRARELNVKDKYIRYIIAVHYLSIK